LRRIWAAGTSKRAQMPLFAHRIGFGEPRAKLVVHVARSAEPESVNVIVWRNSLDLPEAGMLQPTREHDMAIEPIRAWCHLRKRHPHLESDAGLLGKHSDWAKRANR